MNLRRFSCSSPCGRVVFAVCIAILPQAGAARSLLVHNSAHSRTTSGSATCDVTRSFHSHLFHFLYSPSWSN